jgi:glucose/arabinose dehydrogenase
MPNAIRLHPVLSRAAMALLLALPLLAAAPGAPRPALHALGAPFSGPDIPVRRDLVLQSFATAPGSPTAITNAGDDRLFVTLRDGRVVIYKDGGFVAQPFLDLRGQVSLEGEQGLLSTAFHPRYAQNGFFFVNYTNTAGDTVIARFQVSADPDRADPGSRRILLTIDQPFSNHNGGQLQFGPDGYLYIGMGDGGGSFDAACNAQRTDTLLGKMLRLDVDQNAGTPPYYGIPADNPFRGPGGFANEVWALGLRNPWRFSFDRQTGDLWIGDVGQNQIEEVDFQPAGSPGGQNYGWRVMEGDSCLGRGNCAASVPACFSSAYTLPVVVYDHSTGNCSITGGYVYRGSDIPGLRGTYLFGDFCTGTVWTDKRISSTAIEIFHLQSQVQQLVTFGEDRRGEVYLASLGGALYRLTGEAGPPPPPETTDGVGVYTAAVFSLKDDLTTGPADHTVRFGRPAWMPIAGDWNGDGHDSIGAYDAAKGLFRLKNSLTGGNADILLRLRLPFTPARPPVPVAGDWDGDGKDGVGLFSPPSTFYLKDSLSEGDFDHVCSFDLRGRPAATYVPIIGDWDGDGRDTIGLYRPQNGDFILGNGCDQEPEIEFLFGTGGPALPLAGDWDGDGGDSIGLYDPRNSTFVLANGLTGGAADLVFRLRPRIRNAVPLAGHW